MVVADFTFALVLSAILVGLFWFLFLKQRFSGALFLFFFVLFLTTWAGGLWIAPIGPLVGGVPWLSFLVVGLFFAVLLAALIPPVRPPRSRREAAAEAETRTETVVALNVFFWVLIAFLALAILIRYL